MNKRIESGISRRTFVKAASTAAGSLLVGIHLPASSEQKRMPLQQTVMNSFIRIDNDNTLNYFVGRSYYKTNMKYKNPPVSKGVVGFESMIDWNQPVRFIPPCFTCF